MAKSPGMFPIDIAYATWALTPCTSRSWISAEFGVGTLPARHVVPPSVVTTKTLLVPTAQTTLSSTGLTAISSAVVLLFCGVSVGCEELFFEAARALNEKRVTSAVRKQAGKRFVITISSETIGDLVQRSIGRLPKMCQTGHRIATCGGRARRVTLTLTMCATIVRPEASKS